MQMPTPSAIGLIRDIRAVSIAEVCFVIGLAMFLGVAGSSLLNPSRINVQSVFGTSIGGR